MYWRRDGRGDEWSGGGTFGGGGGESVKSVGDESGSGIRHRKGPEFRV